MVGAEPSRTVRYLPVAALLIDLVMVFATGAIADVARNSLDFFSADVNVPEQLGLAGPLILLGWVGVIAACGGYERSIFGSGTDEYKRVVRATAITAAGIGIGCYLVRYDLSRGFFLIAFAIGLPALFLGRYLVRKVLQSARSHGHLQVRVLMAGTPHQVDEVTAVLQNKPWLGYAVVGAVVPDYAATREETRSGLPIYGPVDDTLRVAQETQADIIFFAGGSVETGEDMKRMVWELEELGVDVVIAPSVTDVASERISIRPIGGLPLIHVGHPTWVHASRWGKRAFDVVGSTALILALSPMLIFVSARIWLADRGPIMFKHHRVGRHGERFECLKFRTMVPNAEALVEKLQQETG